MVLRLSELLDPIRPAGTPGAPSDGDRGPARVASGELAEIAEILAEFEAEAERVVAAARDRAQMLREDADQEVHRIHAEIPGLVAVAGARGAELPEQERKDELLRIAERTVHDLELLRTRSDSEMPRLVEIAIAVIWDLIASPAVPGSTT